MLAKRLAMGPGLFLRRIDTAHVLRICLQGRSGFREARDASVGDYPSVSPRGSWVGIHR
jgi:hypothetical protein